MFKIKPESYEGLSLYTPIVLPNNPEERIDRLKVLLGSLSANNSNPDILTEISAILDSLLQDKKINKMQYKLVWYKAKNLMQLNERQATSTGKNIELTI